MQRLTRLIVLVALAAAAARAEEHPVELDPVVVTATRLPQSQSESNAAISVVNKEDIQEGRATVGLEESLNRLPGVLIQNSGNYAQDARIQIRGFGTRAGFGVREVRVLVDGLPETLPDGQTELDSVDFGAIDHIEVLRGPASSLYGNASGGVIQLFTEDAPTTPTLDVRGLGGSFGMQKYQVKGGTRSGPAEFFVHGSYFETNGYRRHSAATSGVVTAKMKYKLSDDTDFMLLFSGVDAPRGDDPGALTRAEANAHPQQANPLNVQLDAGESVRQQRLGGVLRTRGSLGELSSYAYILYRDFESRLAVLPSRGEGIVAFERLSPGAGLRWAIDQNWYAVPVQFLTGLDVQYQDDNRRRYANNNGEKGELRLHQRERVTSVGPYARVAATPIRDVELSIGARYDSVRFDVAPETPIGVPGDSQTLDQWSPSGGVRYSSTRLLSLFANVGTAFQTPTTTELVSPDGPGLNPNIGPQTAISYEGGVRLEGESRWRAELVGFLIDINDELVRFESTSGRTAFRNAGQSRRGGAEVDGTVELLPGLRWTSALSVIDARYRSYRVGKSNFTGNDEPGIPLWRVFSELAYHHNSGIYGGVELVAADKYFVDDANSATSPGYKTVNVRFGFDREFGAWRVSPFLGLNNLNEARYDGTVRLNALAGRFFEPAPGFNLVGGLQVAAHL